MLSRLQARILLSECRGDEIWSIRHCRQRGVPEDWIAELADGIESGFQNDAQTIYVNNLPTNQYEGVRDLELAYKLAEFLGISRSVAQFAIGRLDQVRALQEAIEEG